MNINSYESKLWLAAGVGSIGELPNFPYENHQAFINAIKNNEAAIGVEYPAARDMAHVTTSKINYISMHALSWVPYGLVAASVAYSIIGNDWWKLTGVPVSIAGMFFAGPYLRKRTLYFLVALGLLAYCVYVRSIITTPSWLAFVFSMSFYAIWFLNRRAWRWARNAILNSEAFAAYLWKTANFHIATEDRGIISVDRMLAWPHSKPAPPPPA